MRAALSDREKRIRQHLKDDFPHYAERCLKIRTKAGQIEPLVLNAVQQEIHRIAQAQLSDTGRVRLIVLKARQPGVSTYVEGRFYWRVTHTPAVRAFILTHLDAATDNIFAMARRFHENCPDMVKPSIIAASAKELSFGDLDSGYRVGTAKTIGIGRSDTIQFFHGSEVASWPNAEEHASGVLQAVPDVDGTEVWLESTAQGAAGLYFGMYKAAEAGESDYQAVFVPWFVHSDYISEPDDDISLPPAFLEYAEAHNLTPPQIHWAWRKNSDMASADGLPPDEICWRFRQEYPATSEEAFRASREGAFISPECVLRARKAEDMRQDHAALVIGCDFARGERDYNWFMSRRGRVMGDEVNLRFHSGDTEDIAGKLARVIDRTMPAQCFLDSGGGGAAVYDILRARNYRNLTLINFGSKADDGRLYANKRAEMWGELRSWLLDPGGVSIPDNDTLDGEMTAPGYKYNASQQIVLESKDRIRARLNLSPDGGDAAALTFAHPVHPPETGDIEDFAIGQDPDTGY